MPSSFAQHSSTLAPAELPSYWHYEQISTAELHLVQRIRRKVEVVKGVLEVLKALMARQKQFAPMVPVVYDLVLWVLSILVDLFFREVHPRGSWRIPRRGPVIFVAAPHANQV